MHVYDGEWLLAGMSVREEHDYDMNIIFEDPASDANLECGRLPLASGPWAGRTVRHRRGLCARQPRLMAAASDGQRDYTLDTIYTTLDKTANAAVSDLDRWGIPSLHLPRGEAGQRTPTPMWTWVW